MIVARHEVPGVMKKNTLVPAGRLNGSRLRRQHTFQEEYLAFLKRPELRFDDKYL
jgi:hypothetical protein